MKLILRVAQLLLVGVFTLVVHAADPAADPHVFELRTYTAHPGKLANVLARFRDHTTKLFEKHGMVNVGYFVPMDSADGASDKLVYVLEHANRTTAKASWAAFSADPEWKAVREASEVAGKIVAKAESVFLAATDFSPSVVVTKSITERVFELRIYTTPEGKLDALDARFRDHTRALFTKHGMTNIAYFHPADVTKGAGHTLVYFLAHESRAAAEASWKSFRDDPEWIAAKAASEVGGKLTSEIKAVFLVPTDFSMTK